MTFEAVGVFGLAFYKKFVSAYWVRAIIFLHLSSPTILLFPSILIVCLFTITLPDKMGRNVFIKQ